VPNLRQSPAGVLVRDCKYKSKETRIRWKQKIYQKKEGNRRSICSIGPWVAHHSTFFR
jgi:hypothetical protein